MLYDVFAREERAMPSARYCVDDSDPAFPTIRRCRGDGGVTLKEAKAEIIERASGIVRHWREVMRGTRALKAEDVQD
jgi:hypothetical protein